MADRTYKVLVCTPLYPPDSGGPATYTRFLEEHLPERGFEVAVLSFSMVRHLPKGVRHIWFLLQVLWRGRTATALLALDPVSVGLPVTLANWFLRKPLLLKVVGDYAWEQGVQRFGIQCGIDSFAALRKLPWPVALLRGIERWVAVQATSIVVPSEYLRDIVLQWGVPRHSIHVIYNAFTPLVVPTPTGPISSPTLVSVGRLVPWKGFLSLMEVFAEVRKSHPNCRLIIIGDGPDEAMLRQEARSRGLLDAVLFTGRLAHAEVVDRIASATVFVLNTAYEGLSHVLLEALSVGVPIITTRVGGNSELIEDGLTGIMVQHGNKEALASALLRLLSDTNLQLHLRKNSSRALTKFSPAVAADSLVNLLKVYARHADK